MLQDMDTLDSEDISKFTAEEHNVISGIKNAHVAACYRKEDTRKSRQRFQRLFHFSQQNLCLIQLQTAREPLGNTNNMLRRECWTRYVWFFLTFQILQSFPLIYCVWWRTFYIFWNTNQIRNLGIKKLWFTSLFCSKSKLCPNVRHLTLCFTELLTVRLTFYLKVKQNRASEIETLWIIRAL